jgi:hypothetical protein
MRRYGSPTTRKEPLAISDLKVVIDDLKSSTDHDSLLFISQLLTGFTSLLRLGELVFPDTIALRNFRKVSARRNVHVYLDKFSFFLPGHKADPYFEGNTIFVQSFTSGVDPHPFFTAYLKSRDHLFPCNPHLWLRENGTIPCRSWFIDRLRSYFPPTYAGQSMRAGGATALALAGVQPHVIRAIGRWKFSALAFSQPTEVGHVSRHGAFRSVGGA